MLKNKPGKVDFTGLILYWFIDPTFQKSTDT